MNNNLSKDLYNKYFREEENHSVTFLGGKLIILFPKEYVKKKIVEITNKTINILLIHIGVYLLFCCKYIMLEFVKNEINFQIQLKYHVGYKIHNSCITLNYCLVDVQKTPPPLKSL